MYKGSRVFCFVLSLAASACCYAQFDASNSGFGSMMDGDRVIHGQLVQGSQTTFSQLYVEVKRMGAQAYIRRVPVSGDGSFEFDGSVEGNYVIRVTDLSGNVIAEEMGSPTALGYMEVQLSGRDSQPIRGTISAFELSHKVPGKALKEARNAEKSLKKKDNSAYIEHMEKAVAIDPEYLAGRRNLGIMYLRSGQFEKSIGEFQEVLKRDSKSLTAYAGMSLAYLQMHNFKDAETAARRAVDVDPGSDISHYYLGVCLQLQSKDDAEALQHLKRVAGRLPKAHLIAAEILQRMGKKKEAKGQLQAYIASGDKEAQSDVKTWLSSLN